MRCTLVNALRGSSWKVIETFSVLALQTKAAIPTSSVMTDGRGESEQKGEKREHGLLTGTGPRHGSARCLRPMRVAKPSSHEAQRDDKTVLRFEWGCVRKRSTIALSTHCSVYLLKTASLPGLLASPCSAGCSKTFSVSTPEPRPFCHGFSV